MFKEKYRLDNEYIKPDEQSLASLKLKMLEYSSSQESNATISIDTAYKDPITSLSSKDKAIKSLKLGVQKYILPLGSIAACVLFILFMNQILNISNNKLSKSLPMDTPEDTASTAVESTMLAIPPLSLDPLLIDTIIVKESEKDSKDLILIENSDTIYEIIQLFNTIILSESIEIIPPNNVDYSITLNYTDSQIITINIGDNMLNYNDLWYPIDSSDLEHILSLLEH